MSIIPAIAAISISRMGTSGGGGYSDPIQSPFMKIKGKLDTYNVLYRTYGHTYAEAVVYKTITVKTWFGITKEKQVEVWSTKADGFESINEVETWLPNRVREWFTKAVAAYETYTIAWNEENSRQD